MSNRQKMRETISAKTITGIAAIALFALAFVPASAFASSAPSSMSLNMQGAIVTPQGAVGTFSLTLSGPAVVQKGNLVQGAASGTFNGVPVAGGWSYNIATGQSLMKVAALDGSFKINLAFLGLPSPGFTFQGSLFYPAQAPQMLVGSTIDLTFS